MSLVNPYNLLGISIDSSLKELRKNYYELALICHPDKGGDSKDMIVLHRAYLYCKQQLEYAEENTPHLSSTNSMSNSEHRLYQCAEYIVRVYSQNNVKSLQINDYSLYNLLHITNNNTEWNQLIKNKKNFSIY